MREGSTWGSGLRMPGILDGVGGPGSVYSSLFEDTLLPHHCQFSA